MAWGVYESWGNKRLKIWIYGQPGQEEAANIKFLEEKLFSIIEKKRKKTYDQVIPVGDWTTFLDPQAYQKNYADPTNIEQKQESFKN